MISGFKVCAVSERCYAAWVGFAEDCIAWADSGEYAHIAYDYENRIIEIQDDGDTTVAEFTIMLMK